MNKLDYYRAVLLGVVIGMAFLSFFYVFTSEDKAETKPKSNFEIVDNYKGCDVVRWNNGMLAEYKYFLDCKNER
jgi:hypothetical protein